MCKLSRPCHGTGRRCRGGREAEGTWLCRQSSRISGGLFYERATPKDMRHETMERRLCSTLCFLRVSLLNSFVAAQLPAPRQLEHGTYRDIEVFPYHLFLYYLIYRECDGEYGKESIRSKNVSFRKLRSTYSFDDDLPAPNGL